MRILICDDDEFIINKLHKYIRSYFEHIHLKCPEITSFTNGEALLADSGDKDILFLDIEMPGMNGIYIGNEIKKRNKDTIIFIITSFSEYLDEAMRFHVFRYLSKPIDKQRLYRNLKDAIEMYHSTTAKIPIETKQGVHLVSVSSVVMIEALRKKVIVHTASSDFESVHNMQYWIKQLPPSRFFQTHRSYIINYEYINDFDHFLIHLANGQFNAYLTKRKYITFKEAYLLYLESTR